jgi:hypothetical protein
MQVREDHTLLSYVGGVFPGRQRRLFPIISEKYVTRNSNTCLAVKNNHSFIFVVENLISTVPSATPEAVQTVACYFDDNIGGPYHYRRKKDSSSEPGIIVTDSCVATTRESLRT